MYLGIILSGRKLNENMSQYVAEETLKLAKQKLNFRNLRIAILGFAFKEKYSRY